MCFGTSTPEGIINREINRSLKQERRLAPNSLTLLLLGTGESGKSTILKQFRILHANGFTDAEVEAFKHQIRVNIMHTIISLCRAANISEFANNEQRRDAEFFASINGFQHELNTGLALKIDGLWNDPVIRDVYAKRATALQVQSNAKNLLDSVMRVSACDYFPSEQDILWCKLRTVGVCELQFIQQGVKFKVLDLGGQRAERKKWHVFFQGVSALIYVVALDDYDLKLREDEKVNRMEDSLTLFSQICNMPVFNDTSIILFLNKKDLFKKKLAHSDLSVLFPDYPGGDYKFACSFIEEKYLDQLTTEKKIFTHFTCATSTKNIKHVFQDVRTSILISNLTATGF